jgi:hypothetical protein
MIQNYWMKIVKNGCCQILTKIEECLIESVTHQFVMLIVFKILDHPLVNPGRLL